MRGLKTKLLNWRTNVLISDDIQLLAITETFLDESIGDAELYGSSGTWAAVRRDRRSRAGGGVMLAARTPLTLERLTQYETTEGEDLWARIDINGHYIYVCVVYIPPRSSDETYMKWFDSVECVSSKVSSSKILILGDLNLYSASYNVNNYFECFKTLCDVEQYNYETNKDNRVLDVVMTSQDIGRDVSVRAAIPSEVLTRVDMYHPPLIVCIGYSLSGQSVIMDPSNIPKVNDWNFAKGNYLRLYCMIRDYNWNKLCKLSSVDETLNLFYMTIYNVFDQCFPKKIRKVTCYRTYPTYYTSSIIRNIRAKAACHRRWKKTKDKDARDEFERLRRKIKHDIKIAYINYTKLISANLTKNPKEFWQYINNLRAPAGNEPKVTRGNLEYKGAAAAMAFAEHFSSVFLPDEPELDPATAGAALPADSRRVDIPSFSLAEVRMAISKLKPDASPGPDAVPAFVLKGCIDEMLKCAPRNIVHPCQGF